MAGPRRHLGLAALFLSVVLAATATTPAAAQDVSVQALVNDNTVGDEEVLGYTLEVDGAAFADVETPTPPETEGLTLVQAVPSTQRNISFINGELKQSVSFQWTYRPVRTGEATLGPMNVTVKGETYATDPIHVEVVPQSQRPSRVNPARRPGNSLFTIPDPFVDQSAPPESGIEAQDLFIRAVPSARRAYVNEQVTIEYQLFFRSHIQPRHSRLADSWDAEGFWREELDVEARPMPRATVENGLRYNSIVLKRVAVFPTRSGNLDVDPLRIETEVFAPRRGDPFGGLFSSMNPYETVERSSPAVRIEALPMPAGAPDSFHGAVGRFTMDSSTDRTDVEVGEPVQLTVRISGTGNIATLEAPTFRAPGIFETYDPDVGTQINSTGRRIQGTKTFTYLLVPRSNGTFELPALAFTYFDPQTTQYKTLRAASTTIHVTGTATTPVAASAMATGMPVDDVAPLIADGDWVSTGGTPFHRSPWTYVLLALPLLGLAGVYGFRRFTHRLATDTAYARSRRAHPLARKHLKQAQDLLKKDDPRSYYAELERAVLGFVGNRLNVAELSLTREQLDLRLQEADLDTELRFELLDLLATCDRARFAPDRPTPASMEASLDVARRLIIALDEAFTGRVVA